MKKYILEQFLYHSELKFSEIEKNVKSRSNKLAYHLKKLVKEGIIEKIGENYKLTQTAEKIIPYITKKQAILPAVLIAIPKNKKIFLHKRTKRPFLGKLSLPGGRILIGETPKQATLRILKEKFQINAEFVRTNSISLEHVKKNNKIIHSFFLILCTAKTKNKVKYYDPEKEKKEIVTSDYKLIKNDLNKEIIIPEITTKT